MKNLEIRQLQQVETVTDNIVEGYALKFDSPSENLGGSLSS
ncbi:maturation protease [Enteroccous phage Ef212]|nr:maturation protease [Enteroccous phage Ef212]